MDAERRRRLLALFSGPRFRSDRAKLIEQSGLTKGRIAQFFDENQRFGELAARGLAERLGLPSLYFEPHFTATGSAASSGSGTLSVGVSIGLEDDLVVGDPSDEAGYNAMATAMSMRTALGQIARKMREADPTKREMVALLMRDIAIRPEALETTLGMLFQMVGVPASTPDPRQVGSGSEGMHARMQAIADQTPSPDPHPNVAALPGRGESTGGQVAPALLGKKTFARKSNKKSSKGSL